MSFMEKADGKPVFMMGPRRTGADKTSGSQVANAAAVVPMIHPSIAERLGWTYAGANARARAQENNDPRPGPF